jgi:SNF2 domain-containing protein
MTPSQWPSGPLHPAQRRYLAEDLMRRRRSDEQRRYAAPQRAAKIDANPHQVAAVIFALARVREGGCILADEVGLGKTIEAGLVIAQLLAEGARRVLLVAPKPLLGQWGQELFQLFDIQVREGQARPGGFDGDGVFLVGRETAGSERGRDALLAAEPFDLCVIDEAHEIFAGVYKRFDKFGAYVDDALQARSKRPARPAVDLSPRMVQGRAFPAMRPLPSIGGELLVPVLVAIVGEHAKSIVALTSLPRPQQSATMLGDVRPVVQGGRGEALRSYG